MKKDKKLYLPVSSQNFNAIFASESISPPRYYQKRNFGSNRFDVLFKYTDTSNILFEAMPCFQIDADSDIETYLLIFEFFELDERYLKEIEEGIWRYDNTIYLNENNFLLHFLDPYVKKVMITDAKTSKTTKCVVKYASYFSDKKISISNLKNFQFPIAKPEEVDIDNKIAIDRLFNSKALFMVLLLEKLVRGVVSRLSLQDRYKTSLTVLLNIKMN